VAADSSTSTTVTAGTAAPRGHWALFFGLAVAVVVVDQLAKAWIVASYQVGVPSEIVGNWVRIWLSHNTGALFGMFRDQALLFAAFSLAVIGIILWYEAKAGGSLVVTLALGLLLGGALGNLADRLRYGYVVDFVDLGVGSWRFYTFNVADSAISGAVLLLLLLAIAPGIAGMSRDG
jgi:signal peptidase II